ncbi:PIN domain-containing protein [Leptospira sp. GIMC2001]|uniref:PIN domain-containing protein n=1 Tax=Leptospira sp. GIMC2001 TaxID=1513297 RepID=UPI002349B423|nr:PIN domain-containing protein [Leptospira sp. GIMC2001]WCL51024.1 PIN domain-containing protein [Leptospira sp. GIMC2001]
MNVLLDTNIVIHREASQILNKDIGILFKWLEKGKYTKFIHPVTIKEIEKNSNVSTRNTFKIKLESYQLLKTTTQLNSDVMMVSAKFDISENDRNDSILLNEVYTGRIDFLITEDKKIHTKAEYLNISDRVFKIDSFLEKVVSENPDLLDYKVLSVKKKYFGEVNINDPFFDSFKEDYADFEKWFLKKSDEIAYVTINRDKILSFLYLKVEDRNENYSDITPNFNQNKRLKIGTFKVINNGVRLGERFIKIIFDNALQFKVDEIYVTIFEKREEQQRLISLLEEWGFYFHGTKSGTNGIEKVYVRNFLPKFNSQNPKLTFPYISMNNNIFMIPIYPDYHTELLPDSILTTESSTDFVENQPHRNAISKVYISRSIERGISKGDLIIFYRTAAKDRSAYYSSVITTIAIAEGKIDQILDENDFILKCRKRSVFSDEEIGKFWNWNKDNRPFIINFLYTQSFPTGKRINRQRLLELGILTGHSDEIRGLKRINKEQFKLILKETETNESLIVD